MAKLRLANKLNLKERGGASVLSRGKLKLPL
jgi:hypothetical protein